MIKIEDYEWLVGKIMNKYYSTELDREDLWQEGRIGLLKAREKFDPERGVKFSTFAYRYVQTRLSIAIAKARPGGMGISPVTFLKKIKNRVKDEHIDESISRTRTSLLNVDKELSTEMDINKLSNKLVVEKMLSLISEDEAKLIKLFYGIDCEPKIYAQIAEEYNVSKNTIGYRIRKILKKMTEKMVELGDVNSWS